MMLMAIGILGIEIFQSETQGTLAQGEEMNLAGYTVQYRELASWDDQGKGVNYTRAPCWMYTRTESISGNSTRALIITLTHNKT